MSKRNLNSFDLFGGDSSIESEIFCPLFEERSKTQSHEYRFKVKNNNFSNFEKSQKLTKKEEIQS